MRCTASAIAIATALGLVGCEQRAQQPEQQQRAHLEIIEPPPSFAPTDDLASLVRTESASARQAGKTLLVYVGATWCEPCRRFHDAAAAGQLDDVLSQLRLLELDNDRYIDALQRAGYKSDLIPLFALPNPDGTASGKQIEGSIKGEGAVAQITPRLQALLQ